MRWCFPREHQRSQMRFDPHTNNTTVLVGVGSG